MSKHRDPKARARAGELENLLVQAGAPGIDYLGDDQVDLGPCCGCDLPSEARNVILLDNRCAVPGHGWGCLVCHLPPDGASAVLCDPCLDAALKGGVPLESRILRVCRGYPELDGREPIAAARARGPHFHDQRLHGAET